MRDRSKSPSEQQHDLKKVKREREDERANDSDNEKSDSELVVDDLHNENLNNGNGNNGTHNGGLSSRSPHENGSMNNANSTNGLNENIIQNAKNFKKEENSRSPHSDNSSRSTPSAKVILFKIFSVLFFQIYRLTIYINS